eukprot:Seg2379.3 transcript_id=Seg2379.3/GoldUCD/mRNA.D3Y31 product="hypothetical protein" protein_id=Seg2379.3/GoldUCD/D3Y31
MASNDEGTPSKPADDNASDRDQNKSPKVLKRRKVEVKSNLGPSNSDEKQEIAQKLKRKRKKDENLGMSRFLSFLMISPTVLYVFSVGYDIISGYSFAGKIYHFGALVVGFSLAALACIFLYKPLKPFIKYLAVVSLFILFIPTIQVFNCSPLHLNNSDIGKLVRLKEDMNGFLKIAYQESGCSEGQWYKTPYEFSLYSPSLRIHLKPYQIINIAMQHFDQKDETYEGPPAETLPYQLYLLTSQRSVKRQMYYINLLTMVPMKMLGIAQVLDLGVDDRENVTINLTGFLRKLDGNFNDTKKQLEDMEYLLRPLVFHVQEVDVFGMPEKDDEEPGKKSHRKNHKHEYDQSQDDD